MNQVGKWRHMITMSYQGCCPILDTTLEVATGINRCGNQYSFLADSSDILFEFANEQSMRLAVEKLKPLLEIHKVDQLSLQFASFEVRE